MIENLPVYISVIFILVTFLTVGFLLYAVKKSVPDTIPANILIFFLTFWLFFQGILGIGGFYQTPTFPPRVFLLGGLPAILLMIGYFIFFRKNFIEELPLRILTLLHLVRIPVEFVLVWLYQEKMIPQEMTLEGRNFDILSGLTAPIMYFLAFRGGRVNRPLLIGWNIFALLLLTNILVIAFLSFPTPVQKFGFDQPNRAVGFFPFVWLPTVIIPIVLFSHLASLWKLLKNKTS